jgi:hypothetical protein
LSRGGLRTFSPLTPALSPLRGEGARLASRVESTSRAALAAFPQDENAGTRQRTQALPRASAATPSPLNGRKADAARGGHRNLGLFSPLPMNLKIARLIINDLRILRFQGFNARILRGILTPALSPLRGEGARLASRVESTSRAALAAFPQDENAGTRQRTQALPRASAATPSPLNGERAGVRGENVARCPRFQLRLRDDRPHLTLPSPLPPGAERERRPAFNFSCALPRKLTPLTKTKVRLAPVGTAPTVPGLKRRTL